MKVKVIDKSMKNFRKWAEGKNPFLAGVALKIAGFSETCFKMSELLREEKRIEGYIPLPLLKKWLKPYRNPKRIGKALFNAMESVNDDNAKEAKILQILNEGASQLQNNVDKVKNGLIKLTQDEWKLIEENSTKMMEEFKELAIHNFVSEFIEKDNEQFKKNLATPEMIFFIRVIAPCFSIYYMYPHELLRQAQKGDDDALEKIIRLDKSIIFEPKISEIIHQAQALKEQARMNMIKTAFTSPPSAPLKMRTIKDHLGGLILYLSEAIKQKMTTDDIVSLYDAIAEDMGIAEGDRDLEKVETDAFDRAIRRARNKWTIILPLDKK
jgi:hypothetical protein